MSRQFSVIDANDFPAKTEGLLIDVNKLAMLIIKFCAYSIIYVKKITMLYFYFWVIDKKFSYDRKKVSEVKASYFFNI